MTPDVIGLTAAEAASEIGCSVATLYRLLQFERVTRYRRYGRVFFDVADVKRLARKRRLETR